MIRLLCILTIILIFFSCNAHEKRSEATAVDIPKRIDILEADHDTLPNGKRLLNNTDSSMTIYYKEVVGSDTLEGGYIICYAIDDRTKYLYLMHGDTLRLLNRTPAYVSAWSLGTLEKDFETFFMTRIDNGNGSPYSFQIFDKKTGGRIPSDKVELISYAYLQDTLFMLYENHAESKKADSITLLNTKTSRTEVYPLPGNLPEFCEIQIEKISRKKLTISFMGYAGDNTAKTYSR